MDSRWQALRHHLGDERGRRGITLALVLLAGASLVGWGWAAWRALGQPAPAAVASPPVLAAPQLPSAEELGRWMGASPAAVEPAPAQRFVLVGIVAAGSGRGAALVSVDGQPARPYAVGAQLAPGFVLQRLAAREAVLAEAMDGPPKLVLPLAAWEPRQPAGGGPSSGAPQGSAAPAAAGAATPPDAAPAADASNPPVRRGDQR